jgi:hypothetical protein
MGIASTPDGKRCPYPAQIAVRKCESPIPPLTPERQWRMREVGSETSRPVSRVLFTAPKRGEAAIPLGPMSPPASSNLPERRAGNRPRRSPFAPFLFGLAPGGVYRAAPVARSAVGSYPTLSPLPRPYFASSPETFPPQRAEIRAGRSAFCGTFPGVSPAGRYPAPYFRGARTFLTRCLSTPARAAARPAGNPYKGISAPKGNDP